MTKEEKQGYLYFYCEDHNCDCDTCVLNKSEHMWSKKCAIGINCPSFLQISEQEIDKAIKLIQESDELDKAHDTDKLIDNVNHPSHYQGKNECIDVMVAMFGVEAVKHFCMCNAYKYRFRSSMKNGEEDIKKAEWYEDKLIELEGDK